jgi:hypothetical protein
MPPRAGFENMHIVRHFVGCKSHVRRYDRERDVFIDVAEWTSKGELRQPVYLGLRSDKRATDVLREQELPPK